MKVFSKLDLLYPRIIPVLLLLVLARKTLNQTLRQVKEVNTAATVGKHQEVKFSLLYNKELRWPVRMAVVVILNQL